MMHISKRGLLVVLALLIAIGGGYSITGAPEYETVCSVGTLSTVVAEGRATTLLFIRVGNTGQKTQQRVSISLPLELKNAFLVEPRLSRMGKISAAYQSERTDSTETVNYGPLEPARWVELSGLLYAADLEAFRNSSGPCPRFVSALKGPVREGDVEMTRLGRFFYAILRSII